MSDDIAENAILSHFYASREGSESHDLMVGVHDKHDCYLLYMCSKPEILQISTIRMPDFPRKILEKATLMKSSMIHGGWELSLLFTRTVHVAQAGRLCVS